jgi:hypothetical protein
MKIRCDMMKCCFSNITPKCILEDHTPKGLGFFQWDIFDHLNKAEKSEVSGGPKTGMLFTSIYSCIDYIKLYRLN